MNDWTLTYTLPPGIDGAIVAGWMVNHALASGAPNAIASPLDDSLVRELAEALRDVIIMHVPVSAYGTDKAVKEGLSALDKFNAIYGSDESEAADEQAA